MPDAVKLDAASRARLRSNLTHDAANNLRAERWAEEDWTEYHSRLLALIDVAEATSAAVQARDELTRAEEWNRTKQERLAWPSVEGRDNSLNALRVRCDVAEAKAIALLHRHGWTAAEQSPSPGEKARR